ncbi:hypothetical protein J4214_01865 [Candidatus Woesearchaeota archaeon]|nr:hypothetical protein [Candidatus Woesearchaeota archaeon]
MKPLLEYELITAESNFRPITLAEQPMFASIPIEKTEPDPNHRRHWMFATDNEKILAHVYKPDYILKKFKDTVVPVYARSYGLPNLSKDGITRVAKTLIYHTFDYLLFHELFHPVFLPKSEPDKERFDVALKNGIKRAEPHLKDPDVVNKAGNSRNAMWDFFIDTFFFYLSQPENTYGRHFKRIFVQNNETLESITLKALPDGIITAWDVIELADNKPQTLFYPITRGIYSLLFSNSGLLRESVFTYFNDKIKDKIQSSELRNTIITSLSNAVKYLDQDALRRLAIDRNKFIDAITELYDNMGNAKTASVHQYIVKAITEIGMRPEFRYASVGGIIEPLSKYIDINKEERRDGAYIEDQEGQGSEQTSPTQSGGGAEEVLQSLINQNDPDLDNILSSVANDQTQPRTNRRIRLSNLAKDQYYKKNAKEISIRSPITEAVEINLGFRKVPVKINELLLTQDQLYNLPFERLYQFQLETGIQCLFQLSDYQYRYDIYEWKEEPIRDFTYTKSGIILPDNIIFRVDGSGSMLNPGGAEFVGSKSRYDCLMHVLYGITKSTVKAAREMNKQVSVVGVNYSSSGKTKVSQPVELQMFCETPNNNCKGVLLNPGCGSTYHDISAYQAAYKDLRPGKTLDITIADGDLDSSHDDSIAEYRKILAKPENTGLYFPIFQEGRFALRMKLLTKEKSNLVYRPFLNFNELQAAATDLIIQYARAAERFGKA